MLTLSPAPVLFRVHRYAHLLQRDDLLLFCRVRTLSHKASAARRVLTRPRPQDQGSLARGSRPPVRQQPGHLARAAEGGGRRSAQDEPEGADGDLRRGCQVAGCRVGLNPSFLDALSSFLVVL